MMDLNQSLSQGEPLQPIIDATQHSSPSEEGVQPKQQILNAEIPSAALPEMQPPCKQKRFLIINPNATTSMTDRLVKPIEEMEHMYCDANSRIEYHFYTAPKGPASINNEKDALHSAHIVLADLHKRRLLPQYDAFLVACYSSHPLVRIIRNALTNAHLLAYVTGIFHASITYTLDLLPGYTVPGKEKPLEPGERYPQQDVPNKYWKFGIVTTGQYWEGKLTTDVLHFLKAPAGHIRFAGVAATGLNADQLHTSPEEELAERMNRALTKLMGPRNDLKVIILGCAGMAGMEALIKKDLFSRGGEELVEKVIIVDGVMAGIAQLKRCLEVEEEFGRHFEG